ATTDLYPLSLHDALPILELPRRAKALFQSGQRASKSKASARDLHQLRIEAKKLRYTLEMFQSTYPPTVEARIASLHNLQTVLGRSEEHTSELQSRFDLVC